MKQASSIYVSTDSGATVRMTTNADTISAAETMAISATLPRLAGNFPLMIQYWLSKYRWNPTSRIRIAIPINVVPSGLPMLRRREEGDEVVVGLRTDWDRSGGKEFRSTLPTVPVSPDPLKRKS